MMITPEFLNDNADAASIIRKRQISDYRITVFNFNKVKTRVGSTLEMNIVQIREEFEQIAQLPLDKEGHFLETSHAPEDCRFDVPVSYLYRPYINMVLQESWNNHLKSIIPLFIMKLENLQQ